MISPQPTFPLQLRWTTVCAILMSASLCPLALGQGTLVAPDGTAVVIQQGGPDGMPPGAMPPGAMPPNGKAPGGKPTGGEATPGAGKPGEAGKPGDKDKSNAEKAAEPEEEKLKESPEAAPTEPAAEATMEMDVEPTP